MIGTVDVNIQAAKPDFPLAAFKAFVDSPSSVRVRNVPRRIGEWEISGVNISVTYPDATTVERACVCVGGVWVGTIEGCQTTGTSVHGFVVTADGIDESGDVVTGYVLGVGDVEIISRENDVQPGVVMYKGDPGAPGRDGDDGETPYIGENGNWWIGGEDTGKPARGPNGDIPADYDTVRQNAATGANHAARTGNPHATTAEQVGVRVVELVVDGDAKKLYLMLNGERTTERVTSYAVLLAMAKRGLVRLYYNAVGGTGRKALYTAHMVDDNGTPAMRFDATGTLGESVYTRSIALTKSGTDGIAVSIGDLTEISKKADVPALTTTIAESSSGKAADAAAVARLLSGITAHDIVNFFNYKGIHDFEYFADIDVKKDEIYQTSGGQWLIITEDRKEGESVAPYLRIFPTTDGFEKLVALFGSDNKHLGQTITGFAEATIQDKVDPRLNALETAITGVAEDLAAAIGEDA